MSRSLPRAPEASQRQARGRWGGAVRAVWGARVAHEAVGQRHYLIGRWLDLLDLRGTAATRHPLCVGLGGGGPCALRTRRRHTLRQLAVVEGQRLLAQHVLHVLHLTEAQVEGHEAHNLMEPPLLIEDRIRVVSADAPLRRRRLPQLLLHDGDAAGLARMRLAPATTAVPVGLPVGSVLLQRPPHVRRLRHLLRAEALRGRGEHGAPLPIKLVQPDQVGENEAVLRIIGTRSDEYRRSLLCHVRPLWSRAGKHHGFPGGIDDAEWRV